jgi:methylmalonyl-CoA/ethylmalonyl-CoA epimerase
MFANLGIDHIGVAVRDLKAETARLVKDFGLKVVCEEVLPERGVELVFLEPESGEPGSAVELMAPYGDGGAIGKFLDKRGPGLHHICYKVKDIKAAISELIPKGYKPIDKEPRPGARGTNVFFFHPASCAGVLTELCEYAKSSHKS